MDFNPARFYNRSLERLYMLYYAFLSVLTRALKIKLKLIVEIIIVQLC